MNKSLTPVVILLLWGALLYGNTLHNPFVFDDKPNIEDNVLIRMDEFGVGGLWGAAFQTGKAGREGASPRRPVGNISFALNYYVHQYGLAGYHIVNIGIHLLCACFLFFFIFKTLNLPGAQELRGVNSRWIAMAAALLWLAHPVNTQSVTYIVQRYNSLATMFFVLSLLLYVNGRTSNIAWHRWGWFGGAALAGVLSLGAKENAATLPFFILLYEGVFFRDLDTTWVKQHLKLMAGVVFFFFFVALVYLGPHPMEKLAGITDFADGRFTLAERLLTEPRVILRYVGLFFLPYHGWLNLDYDYPLSQGLLAPPVTLSAIAAIFASLGLAVYIAKTHRLPAFCILWFLGTLVIESSVIPVAIIFEHRTYLPYMMLSVIPVWLMFRYTRPQWVTVTVLSAVLVVFSVWTFERNLTWQDKVRLWNDVTAKSPNKARPHVRLGEALAEKGRIDDAMAQYEKALQIEPENEMAHNNLGYVLAQNGQTAKAVAHYEKAMQSRADFATPHNNLGVLMFSMGRIDEAIANYRSAIEIAPHYCDAKSNLASALVTRGRVEEAVPLFEAAIDLCPNDSSAYAGLYGALRLLSKHDAAQEVYAVLRQMDAAMAVEVKTAMDRFLVRQ